MKKVLRLSLLIILSLPILYLLVAIAGALIPVNSDFRETEKGIEIYLRTSEVHTDIVLPLKNDLKNWEDDISLQHSLSGVPGAKYISFGWGDLEFYREVPLWEDLSLKTAFRALFLKSPAALHLEFLEEPPSEEKTIRLKVNREQYLKLTAFLEDSFEFDAEGNVQPIQDLHYTRRDAFYKAKGSLSLFKTCNTWANNALKKSGLKACLWTPLSEGILYTYK
ncbi:MAG TPA: TIGR02117 family protein [Salegentibacter sp.]|uniref:TIGR02117 family protein n=1 Tax=Salegentibacter sp. TaxID=1903072 RepID=UPI002F92FA6E